MIAWFKDVPEALGEQFVRDPKKGEAFAASPESIEGSCNIDASWHGIHFVLTGTDDAGEKPLSDVILGGRPAGVGDPGHIDPPRYLTPEEVAAIAQALTSFTPALFKKRCNIPAMVKKQIYDSGSRSAEDEAEFFLEYYVILRDYYLAAAKNGRGMMTQIA